jgi:DnaK suppressor protein
MTHLPAAEIARFEERLRRRRDELMARIHEDLSETDRENFSEIVGRVRDQGEESVAEITASTSLALLQREISELRDVDAALARIRVGTYGECVECGGEIECGRLEANPTAMRCLEDQRLLERKRAGGVDRSPSL